MCKQRDERYFKVMPEVGIIMLNHLQFRKSIMIRFKKLIFYSNIL